MKKKYSIPFGIAFLAVISILSTSLIPVADESDVNWPEKGSYELVVKGERELYLQGQILYNQVSDLEEQANKSTTWCLKLRQKNNLPEHSFDFYIGDQRSRSGLEQGIYHISENLQGIFKEFEGVFGVADLTEFGELPYFTDNGKITIGHVDENSLTGQLHITLSNYLGEKIQVEGKFVAQNDL